LIGAVSAWEAQYGIENRIIISIVVVARVRAALGAQLERPVIRAAIRKFKGR
jgi:hypothetical protein